MEQADRDMLIEVNTDVKWLKAAIKTHLSEHFRIKILVWGAMIAAATSLLIALV